MSRESSEQKQVIDNEIPSDENVAKSKLAVGHKLGIVIDTTDLPSPTDVKPSLPVTPSHEFNRTKDYLNTEQNKENPTEKKKTSAPVSGVGVTDPTSTSSASSVLPQPPTVPPPLPLRASTSGLYVFVWFLYSLLFSLFHSFLFMMSWQMFSMFTSNFKGVIRGGGRS